jgi:hypothetical protein
MLSASHTIRLRFQAGVFNSVFTAVSQAGDEVCISMTIIDDPAPDGHAPAAVL